MQLGGAFLVVALWWGLVFFSCWFFFVCFGFFSCLFPCLLGVCFFFGWAGFFMVFFSFFFF